MTATTIDPGLHRALDEFRTSYYFLRANRSYLGSIKSTFANIVTLLLAATNQSQPPYDLEKVGKLLRVHTIRELDMAHHGELTPDHRGFTLTLRKSGLKTVQRTTLAHELGHTLFYDLMESPPSRAAREPAIHPSEDKEEWLCFDFARELLMPTSAASESLHTNKGPPSLDELWSFCNHFGVSLTLACRRIFRDLRAWPGAAVFIAEWNQSTRSWKPLEIFKGKEMIAIHIRSKSLSNLLPNAPKMNPRTSSVVLLGGKTLAMETASLNAELRVLCLLRKRKFAQTSV